MSEWEACTQVWISVKKRPDIGEAAFVEKIMKRFHGCSGSTIEALLQNNVEMEAFNNASWRTKVCAWFFCHLHQILTECFFNCIFYISFV